MASNDEADPSGESVKLDTTDRAIDVRSMNKLFPKIDNLEHFPLRVLLNIFEQLDYMDLYNLAEKSSRFESVAKIILNERYSHEYFIVDEAKHKKETYIEFFKRFGNEIKSIKAKNLKKIDTDCDDPEIALITLLLNRAKNLEKLSLEGFPLDYIIWQINKNITHLTLRDCYDEPSSGFSELHKLKKLEIHTWAVISFEKLTAIIRNNPSMEGLVLCDNFYGRRAEIGSNYPFNRLMEVVGTHLKRVKEFEYVPKRRNLAHLLRQIQTDRPPGHIIDHFFNSLKHLESLALSSTVDIFMNFNGLLRRFSLECKSMKHLKLYDIDGDDVELFDIIRSFENIESLALAFTNSGDEIESLQTLVEHLPHLRELDIAVIAEDFIDWSFVLVLLRKCPLLEQFTVAGAPDDGKIEMFATSQFYNRFIEVVQKRNVQLQVKFKDQIIGSISKNEVTWRTKRLRWVGCDQNSSGIHLLDLATKLQAATNADQPSPFDLILGYLDLSSLYSLSQANVECSLLVENYKIQHSDQHGTFIITDEFNRLSVGIFMFTNHVTNLRANILHENIENLLYLQYLLEQFPYLTDLYIYAEANVSPYHLIVPQVRHLVFDGSSFRYYSQLHELSVMCPNLETFELKQEVYGRFDEREKERLEFCNLKRFTLKYHKQIEQQVENLQIIFKDTKTKLCLNI